MLWICHWICQVFIEKWLTSHRHQSFYETLRTNSPQKLNSSYKCPEFQLQGLLHLSSPSTPALDDRRTSIDIIIIKDSIKRIGGSLRWIPTDHMLADAMTKESADALDLLRACIRSTWYQISPEERVLELRAKERDRRRQFAQRAVCSDSPEASNK